MSPSARKSPFPRGALIGAGALIGFTLVAVASIRLTGTEPIARVDAPSEPVQSRTLRFKDRANGDVVVYAADGGERQRVIATLERGEDGFMRGVLRGLTRERRSRGIGRGEPFRLVRRSDGGLLLVDPATGQRIYLQAFGPTNVKAFERLLVAEGGRE